jgi:hypothetical protein
MRDNVVVISSTQAQSGMRQIEGGNSERGGARRFPSTISKACRAAAMS